jgi:peptidoglycan-associated lipoprotein
LLADLFRLDSKTTIMVEGHCDTRGSDEYNLALGDRRAAAVEDALVRLGVAREKLTTISYGKEHPLCDAGSEEYYAQNRRVHFATPASPPQP